jgi:DNA-binding Xre family transcriptional regulator
MNYPEIRSKIKKLLEDQNLTYGKLAESLKMSESGVKKLILAKDISLERLNQICAILGVPLHELLDPGLNQEESEMVVLEEKAQDYFLKNKSCFSFLILLYTEPKSFSEILKDFQIPKTRAYKYLKDLESLKLLKWLPGDKVNLRKDVPTLFKYEGKFMKMIVREWALDLLDEALDAPSGKEHELSTQRIFHLTRKSAIEFKTAFDELVFEFARRSVREKKSDPKRLIPIRSMVVLREGHFVKKI